ncbi:la-related protein 1B-like [Zingiber officinale]|uniref:HTH La-type RNA-binding domain-containing protein n=1 Tax=Zingiber officinale TaxID=94328 RepID=A0A8J5GYC3_ZINOF|nr:la-related protein 1B-like [Zingiber officinale]KAG6509143.1 hypothetical protein ZIOFF_034534 [Zingiber officinale]
MSPAFNSSSSFTGPAAGRPAGRGLASPWSHVVRVEADAATTAPWLYPHPEPVDRSLPSDLAPESSSSSSIASLRPLEAVAEEQGSGGNAAGKKAWNVLSNGDSEGGAVMGATWPELSESAKSIAKPTSSSEPSLVVPDGSDTTHEVPLMAPPKATSNNPNPNSNRSPEIPARQKSIPKSNSIKRGGSSSGSQANGSPSHQQSPTPEITPIALEEGSGSSPNGPSKGSNWEPNRNGGLTTQHHGEDDHRGGFNRNRRGNNNGGGGFHQGGVSWNSARGFNNRDQLMPMPMPLVQQRGYSQSFVQQPPPPPPVPFIGMPPLVRPIVTPIVYPGSSLSDVPHVYGMPPPPPIDPLRNAPFIHHQAPPAIPSTVYIAPVEHFRSMILQQIEYYFSFDNLLKDTYLRQKMDDQGWVPISLIAGFNRVKQLTNDIPFILESLRGSTVVEIQGEKIRRRNDWIIWILPPIPHQHGIVSRPQYTSSVDLILAHVQNLGLSERGSGSRLNNISRPIGMGFGRTVSENLNTQRRDGASVNAINKVSSRSIAS